MKTASAKAKGRLGQQEVAAKLMNKIELGLVSGDITSRPMGSQGEDLIVSPQAYKRLYFDDWEVKRRSRVAIIRWMEQVFKRKSKKAIVCFREDRGEWYCLLKMDDVLELLAKGLKNEDETGH